MTQSKLFTFILIPLFPLVPSDEVMIVDVVSENIPSRYIIPSEPTSSAAKYLLRYGMNMTIHHNITNYLFRFVELQGSMLTKRPTKSENNLKLVLFVFVFVTASIDIMSMLAVTKTKTKSNKNHFADLTYVHLIPHAKIKRISAIVLFVGLFVQTKSTTPFR